MAARPVKIGVGMRDKRARILRCLAAHIGYLATVETMRPWSPPTRPERPARPPDPDPYRLRPASAFFTPREKPELAHPCPGPEALSDEAVKAWVAVEPFVRGGLSYRTQAALAYIETFRRREA